MDDRAQQVLAAGVSDEELAALVAEARALALAEVRERLRAAFVAELLGRLAAPPAAEPPAAEPPAVEPPAVEPPVDALEVELAALRAQLAANQSWLAGALDAEPSPASPAAQASNPPSADPPSADPPSPDPHASNPPSPDSHAPLLWLYAVRRASPEVDVTMDGERIEGVAAGGPVFAIACGDLEALASAVPAAEFGEAPMEANLRDLDWLERAARAHQGVQARLMGAGTIVPLRFATLFSGPERAAAMVAERAEELRAALDHLRGRGEWGVKLLVDEAALAERLADASPAVRELRDAIAAKPAGAAYMLQKRLDRLSAEEARRVSDACADEAHARLAAASVAAERGALRDAPGAAMLLNGAYLVADDAQPAFAATLEALRAEYEPLGFQLALTGPWPPYSFAAPPARASA